MGKEGKVSSTSRSLIIPLVLLWTLAAMSPSTAMPWLTPMERAKDLEEFSERLDGQTQQSIVCITGKSCVQFRSRKDGLGHIPMAFRAAIGFSGSSSTNLTEEANGNLTVLEIPVIELKENATLFPESESANMTESKS